LALFDRPPQTSGPIADTDAKCDNILSETLQTLDGAIRTAKPEEEVAKKAEGDVAATAKGSI
jgi:hypothetical protein